MTSAPTIARRLFAAVIAAALPVAALVAQEKAETNDAAVALDKRIIDAAPKDTQIMKNLQYLSDQIGPRLTGSESLHRANEWAAEMMKSYGLENVHQEGWEVPTGWERGTAWARVVEPNNGRSLTIASQAWSPGTKGRVVGDVVVIEARTSQDLDKYRGKLKNAIILRGKPADVPSINTPGGPMGRRGRGERDGAPKDAKDSKDAKDAKDAKKADAPEKGSPPGKLPDAPANRVGRPGAPDGFDFTRARQFARELSDFLKAEGAAVILQDSNKPQGLIVTGGSWRRGNNDRVSAQEAMASAYIAHEHYAMLYRLATRPAPASTRLEIEITNKFTGPTTCYNTIGEIPGAKKPGEVVVLGAHLDSWDLGSGTTDNGTGSCIVLETARILKKLGVQPDRTIRFILFTGEEQGLIGSGKYVEQHKADLAKISMCLVHDTGTGKVEGIALSGYEAVKPIMERELLSLKPLGVTNISIGGLMAGGSDHGSFANAGVPGFAVTQDMSEYWLTHHTQSDTFDKVHEENLIQGAQVLAVSAVRVANLPNLLPRDRPQRAGRVGRGGGDPAKKDEGKKDEPKKADPAKAG
nr:hypothetical protein Hi04_10k_c2220_00007 [uncultured bacterium]